MDVPGIDLDAADYHYGVCNAGVNLKMKWQADWLLAKEENERQRFLQFLQVCWTYYSYFGIYTLFVF
jgi:hypothetical protein